MNHLQRLQALRRRMHERCTRAYALDELNSIITALLEADVDRTWADCVKLDPMLAGPILNAGDREAGERV